MGDKTGQGSTVERVEVWKCRRIVYGMEIDQPRIELVMIYYAWLLRNNGRVASLHVFMCSCAHVFMG